MSGTFADNALMASASSRNMRCCVTPWSRRCNATSSPSVTSAGSCASQLGPYCRGVNGAHLPHKRFDDRSLADAWLSGDEYDLTLAVQGFVQPVVQLRQLALSTDQRGYWRLEIRSHGSGTLGGEVGSPRGHGPGEWGN